MKNFTFAILLLAAGCGPAFGQVKKPRPDVCAACVMDTTAGYFSIEDTLKHNPVCNSEVLTAAHLRLKQQERDTILFFPHKMDVEYNHSGDARGHVISYEDLAYSPRTAKASMDLQRNLAPQPQLENIGTKYASERLGRQLAAQYGAVRIYGGTFGTLGAYNGINKPAFYWTVITTPAKLYVFWMPTTGPKITYAFLNDPEIAITYQQLVSKLGFDPQKAISEAYFR